MLGCRCESSWQKWYTSSTCPCVQKLLLIYHSIKLYPIITLLFILFLRTCIWAQKDYRRSISAGLGQFSLYRGCQAARPPQTCCRPDNQHGMHAAGDMSAPESGPPSRPAAERWPADGSLRQSAGPALCSCAAVALGDTALQTASSETLSPPWATSCPAASHIRSLARNPPCLPVWPSVSTGSS